tara:strand:- start:2638 stop:3777 length:1140 start_codon:yes stop_codon:yes gene_type:complete
MDLPFIEFKLTDDVEGLQAIALVDRPAIGINYQAFETQKFEVINEEQRIVMGAAMIPDLPIYRRDDSGEYYAIFKKETIKALVQKYFKESKQGSFNEEHDQFKILDGVYVYQSFITDEKLGISAPRGFENIADGTWFIAAKVDNDEAWAKVKEDGLLKGFSVEGIFDLEPYKFKTMNKINLESVISTLKSVFSESETEVVETEETNFAESTLVDGTIVKWEGELIEGTAIIVVLPEGEVAAPDGTHELTDGTVLETAGGLVVSVTEGAGEVATEDNEFTAEQLSEMLEKAMSNYAKEFNEQLEAVVTENKNLSTELSEMKANKENLQSEFSKAMDKVATELEELAKSEVSTSSKPTEFKALTRAEKAASMGAALRATNK